MKYMLLIYSDENATTSATPEEIEAWMGEYFAYSNAIEQAGVGLHSNALHPTATATTVQVRDGKTATTHGPFAETKEQLGGYYLIECENLDQAIEWAARCPGARVGSIELRPVVDFSRQGAEVQSPGSEVRS